jgi:hypothetical protein
MQTFGVRVVHLAADVHSGRLEPHLGPIILAELGDELTVTGLDALQALEKIDVKEHAAKLAVGDSFQAYILLGAHHVADARILDRMQFSGGEAAGGEKLTRFPQPLGAEKAPNMVGAKRRTRHRAPPWNSSHLTQPKIGLATRPLTPRRVLARPSWLARCENTLGLTRRPPAGGSEGRGGGTR